ncbi:MAG: hypothetical protein HXY40_06320 [Chloroflexi bacterium]|nr:hypothetical protein [Chloroflexota bacterium]
MISWKLWKALQKPPLNHPLFVQTVGFDRISHRLLLFAEGLAPATLGTGIILCAAMWFLPHILLLPQLFIAWGTAPLAFIMINGTLFGGIWAATIGKTIAAEYLRKRYDLLCLSPAGVLLTNWAICTACLHRNQLFHFIHSQRNTIIYQVIIPGSALLVLGFTLSVPPPRTEALIINVVGYTSLIIAFFGDYLYSMVLCSLAGILAPALARNSLNAPLWAMGSFLLVQCITYTLILVIDLSLLPTIFAIIHAQGLYADIVLAVLRLLIFFVIRETMVVYLWRLVQRRLHIDPTELLAMMRAPV